MSKKDYEYLLDKNRSVPGKSNLVKRSYQLAKRAKKNDLDARDTLFYLCFYLIKNLYGNYSTILDYNDYIQESYLIFVATVKSFNPKKSNNFQYLFKRNIHNTMLNRVSQNSRHYHTRRNTVYIENLSPEMQERALWSDDKSIDDDIYFHSKAVVEFEIYNNDFEIYQE